MTYRDLMKRYSRLDVLVNNAGRVGHYAVQWTTMNTDKPTLSVIIMLKEH